MDDPPGAAAEPVDALIVTALLEELDALLALAPGPAAWREERTREGLRLHRRELRVEGGVLRLAAAWLGEMGETAAAAGVTRLVAMLDPACIAMCGICAGRRGEVQLGDVIVADRVYSYDHGKHVAGRDDDFFHDIRTYNLRKPWDTDAAYFARHFARTWPDAAARPPSKESQRRWLLHALAAHEASPAEAQRPDRHADRKARCPGWPAPMNELRRLGLIEAQRGALRLTEAGRAQVEEDRLSDPDGEAADPPFRVHVGAIATGKAVQEDPELFPRLKRITRKILGVEMEAAAIGYAAEQGDRRAIIVKAVSDHGDHDKDDSVRGFASRAAAAFLLAFLERYLTPRGEAASRPLVRRPIHDLTPDAIDFVQLRRDDFLARVEQVCRLREPEGAQLTRFPAPLLFGTYLRVSVNEGGVVRVFPLAAIESGVSEEVLDVFLDGIHDTFRRHDPGVVSTLVYGGDPAPDALVERARGRRVRLLRFLEFQGLIDFGRYLDWQTRRLERDPTYPPALYVDQRAQLVAGTLAETRDRALDALIGLLDADHGRFALILGDFGTGKTFLLHELARRMAKDAGPVTPVLIEMRSLEKARDLNALIAQHLALAGMDRISLGAFRHMLAEGRIALLFDGFDELAFRVSYDRAVDHFDTLIQAAQGKAAKVVVTSRSQHFLSERQVRTALAERAAALPGFRLIKLMPFQAAQIRELLVKRLGSEEAADRRVGLLDEVKDLLGLSANPRMLSFIAEIGEEELRAAKAREGEITSAGLYRLLLTRWLEHEYTRAHPRGAAEGLTVAQRWRAVTDLALRLWQRTERSLDVRDLPPELFAALRELGKHELDAGIAAHQIGSGTLLVWDEEEGFRFIHQSVLEWLVASDAAESLRANGEAPALDRREMSDLMADFFGALAGREAAARWVRAALGGDKGEIAAKNGLSVDRRLGLGIREGLNLAGKDLRGQDLAGKDLSYCDLRGADLRGALLVGANLKGAKLGGAKLDGADLLRAVLTGADLSGASAVKARLTAADLRGAKLAGADLRRAKLLRAKGARLEGAEIFGAALPDEEKIEPMGVRSRSCRHVAFSRDGVLLTAGHSHGATVWDWTTAEPLREIHGLDIVTAMSTNGDRIAAHWNDGQISIRSTWTGEFLCAIDDHEKNKTIKAFSHDGLILATLTDESKIQIWDAQNGRIIRTLQGRGERFMSLAFSPDRTFIAASSFDKMARLWDLSTGECTNTIPLGTSVEATLVLSPDGSRLASRSVDERIRVRDIRTGQVIRFVAEEDSWTTPTVFSADGMSIVAGNAVGNIYLWNATRDEAPVMLGHHDGAVASIAFSPDNSYVASGATMDDSVLIWDTSGRGLMRSLGSRGTYVSAMAFTEAGMCLTTVTESGELRVWQMSTGLMLRSQIASRRSATRFSIAPDGETVVSVEDDRLARLWRADPEREEQFLGPKHTYGCAFDPRGETLISISRVGLQRLSCSDGTLIWDRATEWTHINGAVAFSPDGTLVTLATYAGLDIRNASTGESVRLLEGHLANTVAFSPDERTLAYGAIRGRVNICDVTSGQIVGVMPIVSATSLAFSPDGRLLASASSDNAVRLWDVRTGACLATFLHLPEGWAAFTPDGRYKVGGNVAGGFWHVAGLCRFEPGELDDLIPGLRVPDELPLFTLPDAP